MKTTVPFEMRVGYKQCLCQASIAVFTQMPLESDFEIATKEAKTQKDTQKVILDFGIKIFMLSKGRTGRFYLSHEYSFLEQWSAYGLRECATWEDVKTQLHAYLTEEQEHATALMASVNRILKDLSPDESK